MHIGAPSGSRSGLFLMVGRASVSSRDSARGTSLRHCGQNPAVKGTLVPQEVQFM